MGSTGLVITAVVGLLAAFAGRVIMPGKIIGPVGTAIAGIVGGVAAGYAGQAAGWYKLGEPLGFVAAAIGGIVVLAVVSRFFR